MNLKMNWKKQSPFRKQLFWKMAIGIIIRNAVRFSNLDESEFRLAGKDAVMKFDIGMKFITTKPYTQKTQS